MAITNMRKHVSGRRNFGTKSLGLCLIRAYPLQLIKMVGNLPEVLLPIAALRAWHLPEDLCLVIKLYTSKGYVYMQLQSRVLTCSLISEDINMYLLHIYTYVGKYKVFFLNLSHQKKKLNYVITQYSVQQHILAITIIQMFNNVI